MRHADHRRLSQPLFAVARSTHPSRPASSPVNGSSSSSTFPRAPIAARTTATRCASPPDKLPRPLLRQPAEPKVLHRLLHKPSLPLRTPGSPVRSCVGTAWLSAPPTVTSALVRRHIHMPAARSTIDPPTEYDSAPRSGRHQPRDRPQHRTLATPRSAKQHRPPGSHREPSIQPLAFLSVCRTFTLQIGFREGIRQSRSPAVNRAPSKPPVTAPAAPPPSGSPPRS